MPRRLRNVPTPSPASCRPIAKASTIPQVIKDYAEFVGVPEPLARRVRDEFFPKSLVWPDKVNGLDSLMEEAVALKFVVAPLSKEQTAELISIPGVRP